MNAGKKGRRAIGREGGKEGGKGSYIIIIMILLVVLTPLPSPPSLPPSLPSFSPPPHAPPPGGRVSIPLPLLLALPLLPFLPGLCCLLLGEWWLGGAGKKGREEGREGGGLNVLFTRVYTCILFL